MVCMEGFWEGCEERGVRVFVRRGGVCLCGCGGMMGRGGNGRGGVEGRGWDMGE